MDMLTHFGYDTHGQRQCRSGPGIPFRLLDPVFVERVRRALVVPPHRLVRVRPDLLDDQPRGMRRSPAALEAPDPLEPREIVPEPAGRHAVEAVDELLDAAVQAVDAVDRVRAGGVRLGLHTSRSLSALLYDFALSCFRQELYQHCLNGCIVKS